jgi:four helix bundle protein
MAEIDSVEELDVFKKTHKVTLRTYELTGKFPADEKFGLASQMRRAAASMATNLIEGTYRLNRAEYRQFVGIARGSWGELKYHILLAKDLGYVSESDYGVLGAQLDEISKMLMGLAKSLASRK